MWAGRVSSSPLMWGTLWGQLATVGTKVSDNIALVDFSGGGGGIRQPSPKTISNWKGNSRPTVSYEGNWVTV